MHVLNNTVNIIYEVSADKGIENRSTLDAMIFHKVQIVTDLV